MVHLGGGWVGYRISLLNSPHYLFFLDLLWFTSPRAVLSQCFSFSLFFWVFSG